MCGKTFGLKSNPFQLAPAGEDLFMSRPHREGLAALEWGLLHEPTGFMLLVGDPGTGKTSLLCRVLAENSQHIKTVSVTHPKLTAHELLRAILTQLGTGSPEPGRLGLLREFERCLNRLRRLAIVIDEAQDLSDDALEEMRLLSNYRPAGETQLQILLVGHPELLQRLKGPALRQLDQRIGARAILDCLQPAEAYEYVEHLVRASGANASEIFKPRALRFIIRRTGGIPRRINVACHNALLQAYANGLPRVTLRAAYTAIAELENLLDTAIPFERANAETRVAVLWMRRLASSVAMLAIVVVLTIYPLHGSGQTSSSGKTPSISATGTRTSASRLASGSRTISVHEGDTLEDIAVRYLGSTTQLSRLVRANPQLSNPNQIYPGQTIYVPGGSKSAQTESWP